MFARSSQPCSREQTVKFAACSPDRSRYPVSRYPLPTSTSRLSVHAVRNAHLGSQA